MKKKTFPWMTLLLLSACRDGVTFVPGDRSRPAAHLPALRAGPPATVQAGVPITLALALEPAWKINAGAPSWAALYRDDRLVLEIARDELKRGGVRLPALEAGSKARLQGTFFFCEEIHPDVCVQQSRDVEIAAIPGAPVRLTIELKR